MDEPTVGLSRYLGESLAQDLTRCARLRGWRPRVPAHPWQADDGWTMARVCSLVVDHEEGTDQVVLKYSPRLTGEPAAYEAAERHCPPAFRRHLVPSAMAAYLPERGGVLTFQRLAADEVCGCVPLARLPSDDRTTACELIVRRILRDWNAPSTPREPPPVPVTVHSYLTAEIGDALSAHGFLDDWARANGLTPDGSPWLTLPADTTVYPNPLALACPGFPGADLPVDVFLGRGHRDLHALNVLIPQANGRPVLDGFLLIDLADYADRTPLSRDPIFLLLSLVAPMLRDLPAPRCDALADRLAGGAAAGHRDPVLDLVDRVLRGAVDAVRLPGSGWRREWQAQLRLTTLALSVYFTTFTNLGARTRWFLYRLAARMGRDLLTGRGVRIPETGRPVRHNAFHPTAAPSAPPPGSPVLPPVPAEVMAIQRLVARAWTALPGIGGGPGAHLRKAGERVFAIGDAGRQDAVAVALDAQRMLVRESTRILGGDDPTVLSLTHNLAYWLRRAGAVAESASTYREVAGRRARRLGPEHPDTKHSWACSRAFGLEA